MHVQGGQKNGALIQREAKTGEKGVEHSREGTGGAEGNDENAITGLRKAALRLIPAQGAVAPLAQSS